MTGLDIIGLTLTYYPFSLEVVVTGDYLVVELLYVSFTLSSPG